MTPGIEIHVPSDLRQLYEVHEYRHAAALLYSEFPDLYKEICDGLRSFRFTRTQVVESGGNESEIPKTFSGILRPKGWIEGKLSAAVVVDSQTIQQDTHKIDYIKGRVAFDLEWNSKDQTFDRDLFAFRTFFDYNKISVGIIVTRSEDLNSLFRELGITQKYGASTTHLGKLLPRLKAGRGGGCPLLIFGITRRLLQEEE
ncbi:MAG: BglII/BstYI family type II restriction endonuclease [Anaerolineae bacterium]